jgi:transitional endoplasmic reticulum ATPase
MVKRVTESNEISPNSIEQFNEELKPHSIRSTFIVEEIPKGYLGKGLAIIPEGNLNEFGLQESDIIEISADAESSRKTYARIMSGPNDFYSYLKPLNEKTQVYPQIQLDFNTRKNAEVKIGDIIKIRKIIDCPAAKTVILVPENPEKDVFQDFKAFKDYITGRVISKMDDIWIPSYIEGANSVQTPSSNPSTKSFDIYFTVFYHDPKGRDAPAVIIDKNTVVKIRKIAISSTDHVFNEKIYLEDVGGMRKAKEALLEVISVIVNESEFIQKTGLKFTNSVLISGPSGCGKTYLSKAVVNEFPVCYYYINAPEIAGEKPTLAPEDLRKIFEEAEDCGPSIILIDEVEALATNREDLRFDSIMRNIVTQFLHLMESISGKHNVFIIGTTNKPQSIDSSFLSQNRFGKEIKVSPPKVDERREILQIFMNKMEIIDKNNFDIKEIAEHTYGFTGGDLHHLFQAAFIEKLKRNGMYERFLKSRFSYHVLKDQISLGTEDLLYVVREKIVKPTILRNFVTETPKINFSQVGGMEDIKKLLELNIKNPLKHPELYKRYGVRSFKGLLLHGPPGCGKTLLVKALASEADMNFISIKGAEVLNHWLGESEAAVREIFAKAKESAPCIIFFDELDAVSAERGELGNVHSDRVTAQLLTELDGIEDRKDVICIGATNRIDVVDKAIMRPGRLYPVIEIPLPTEKDRKQIFEIYVKTKPLSSDVNLTEIAQLTENFNGAMIEEVCNEAGLIVIKKYLAEKLKNPMVPYPPISRTEFLEAINEIKTRVKMTSTLKGNFYS